METLKCILLVMMLISQAFASKPEQGKFDVVIRSSSDSYVAKTLYVNSTVSLTIRPHKPDCVASSAVRFCWTIRGVNCMGEYSDIGSALQDHFWRQPWLPLDGVGAYVSNCASKDGKQNPIMASCTKDLTSVTYYNNSMWQEIEGKSIPATAAIQVAAEEETPDADDTTDAKSKTKRSANAAANPSAQSVVSPKPATEKHTIANVPFQGVYLVAVWLEGMDDQAAFDVTLDLKSPVGYLSASDYPLKTFYMVMCIIYALFAAAWLLMSACHYRDLLRVQFWIGGVILLGMIEKAVFYGEYSNVNSTGISVLGAAKFAEVVSALKRAVSRMLVIIVSLGFGIVKPRLGPMLHRVIALGVVYFVLAVVEALVQHDATPHDPENKLRLFTFVPLAMVNSIFCWWVFISLLQTMKTLRLRRNVVKLSLYRHFCNTIIFCVVMSVALIIWSIRTHSSGACVYNWSELWLEVALWHVLFSVILFVIMVLWRPNANNQIYAYSPMIDGNDSDLEEAEEPMLGSGATETMKLRGSNKKETKSDVDKTEEDLKWIEENIPQTVADAALPILVDSDEEQMTTKYEMSKIE